MSRGPFAIALSVGLKRERFLDDASISATDFARVLNRAAIEVWPDYAGIQYFGEAGRVLREAAVAGDGEPNDLRHLALILHNSAQLMTFEAWIGSDELPQALDDAGEAVRLLLALVGLGAASPIPETRAMAAEMREDLVAVTLTRARVETACGLIGDAQHSLGEARAVAVKCGAIGEWWDWVEVVTRELAPVRSFNTRGNQERRLWMWVPR